MGDKSSQYPDLQQQLQLDSISVVGKICPYSKILPAVRHSQCDIPHACVYIANCGPLRTNESNRTLAIEMKRYSRLLKIYI